MNHLPFATRVFNVSMEVFQLLLIVLIVGILLVGIFLMLGYAVRRKKHEQDIQLHTVTPETLEDVVERAVRRAVEPLRERIEYLERHR